MIRLVRPAVKYQKSYFQALRGYDRRNQVPRDLRVLSMKTGDAMADFPRFVRRIRGFSRGAKMIPGFVPESRFWLVDGNKYIGCISIRHSLTPLLRREMGHIGYEVRHSERRKGYGTLMLGLALKKARRIGLAKVLVTCDTGNTGSRKVIEANGGKLAGKVKSVGKGSKFRYWIGV